MGGGTAQRARGMNARHRKKTERDMVGEMAEKAWKREVCFVWSQHHECLGMG